MGIRNLQGALRRLRRWARQGVEEELDIADTIKSTAHKGGMLDIKLVPERKNRVKVLIFFDVGGSMDPHVEVCESLFYAALVSLSIYIIFTSIILSMKVFGKIIIAVGRSVCPYGILSINMVLIIA